MARDISDEASPLKAEDETAQAWFKSRLKAEDELAQAWFKWMSVKWFRELPLLVFSATLCLPSIYCASTGTLISQAEDMIAAIFLSVVGGFLIFTILAMRLPGRSETLKSMLCCLTPLHAKDQWEPGDLLNAFKSFDPMFEFCLVDKVVRLVSLWIDPPGKWGCVKKLLNVTMTFLEWLLVLYPGYWIYRIVEHSDVSFRNLPSGTDNSVDKLVNLAGNNIIGVISTISLTSRFLLVGLVPILVSRLAVLRVIHEIKDGRGIDWDELTVCVHVLDKQLERLWSCDQAGGLWVCVLISQSFGALFGAWLFLEGSQCAVGVGLFFFCVCIIILALWPLTYISSLCMSEEITAMSIRSVARSYSAYVVPLREEMRKMIQEGKEEIFEDERQWMLRSSQSGVTSQARFQQCEEHARFMTYMSQNKMGVRVLGVRITRGFLFSLSLQALGVIPAVSGAYAYALAMLKPK